MALGKALSSCIGSGVEGFESQKRKTMPGYTVPKSWINFVVFVIMLLAVAFFGKFLWNELLAGGPKVGNTVGNGFITILKPLPTIWHAIAVYIAIDIFFGGN